MLDAARKMMDIQTPIDLAPLQQLGKENLAPLLQAFCEQWQIVELACFGSIVRDDFRPDSDIDLLVTWKPNSRWTLLDFAQMQFDLETLFHRPVDLVSKRAIEQSDNPLRRAAILNTAVPIYSQR
ncbi:MAG: nucleotidyltransferase family protein [Cyanobacteriota bacterium]|nr:nucleotidyltransferase family protein [Cyanobacteriota bacterium]